MYPPMYPATESGERLYHLPSGIGGTKAEVLTILKRKRRAARQIGRALGIYLTVELDAQIEAIEAPTNEPQKPQVLSIPPWPYVGDPGEIMRRFEEASTQVESIQLRMDEIHRVMDNNQTQPEIGAMMGAMLPSLEQGLREAKSFRDGLQRALEQIEANKPKAEEPA